MDVTNPATWDANAIKIKHGGSIQFIEDGVMTEITNEVEAAIEVLKRNGWQVVNGPHLEDWEEGEILLDEHGEETSVEVRADVAIVKTWSINND